MCFLLRKEIDEKIAGWIWILPSIEIGNDSSENITLKFEYVPKCRKTICISGSE